MDFDQIFQINTPTVVAEVFDDEVVIINMESGIYYSLEQDGAALWRRLQQGASLSELIAETAVTYAVTSDEITPALQQFVAELAENQLVVAGATPTRATVSVHTQANDHFASNSVRCFTPPILNKFTDMQDLLLLDPIHDVDETGWPKRKAT